MPTYGDNFNLTLNLISLTQAQGQDEKVISRQRYILLICMQQYTKCVKITHCTSNGCILLVVEAVLSSKMIINYYMVQTHK
jgi:hypothetical protein